MTKSQERLRRRQKTRRLVAEPLETRCLLAACWVAPGLDVSDDGFVGPIDGLIVINDVNAKGAHPESIFGDAPYTDVNGDGISSANDALAVIKVLNQWGAARLTDIVKWECGGEPDVAVNDPPQSEVTAATDVVFAEVEVWSGSDAAEDLFLTARGRGESLEGHRRLFEVRDLTLVDPETEIRIVGQQTFDGQDADGPFVTYKFEDAVPANAWEGTNYEVRGWLAGFTDPGTQFWIENTNAYAIPQGWQYASSPVLVVESGIRIADVSQHSHDAPLVEGGIVAGAWEISTADIDVPLTGVIISAFVENCVIDNVKFANYGGMLGELTQVLSMDGLNRLPLDQPINQSAYLVYGLDPTRFTATPTNNLWISFEPHVINSNVDPARESWLSVGIENLDTPREFEVGSGHIRWLKDGVETTGLPAGTTGVWAPQFRS